MKLLICLDCMDIFNLKKHEKVCGCGKTKGKYIDDIKAEYSGNAMPIGFANSSFSAAYHEQRKKDKLNFAKSDFTKGTEFTAFFIPASAKSINKVTSITSGLNAGNIQ